MKNDEFWIDGDSMFETEEIAFDEGLQRALYEIKCNDSSRNRLP